MAGWTVRLQLRRNFDAQLLGWLHVCYSVGSLTGGTGIGFISTHQNNPAGTSQGTLSLKSQTGTELPLFAP